jgi:hypothetical protein
MESSVRYEANCKVPATDRLSPVRDLHPADRYVRYRGVAAVGSPEINDSFPSFSKSGIGFIHVNKASN